MSRNVEELLREGIDRATSDAEVPPSLIVRARQHNRRRRQAIAGALAAGTAAVTAAAVIVATSTSGTSPNALHSQTITYVTTRAEQALAHISQSQAIETDTATITGTDFGFTVLNTAFNGTTGSTAQVSGVLSDVHASKLVNWTYRSLELQQGYSATGKLVFTAAIGPVGTGYGKTGTAAYGAAFPARIRWYSPLAGGPNLSPDPLVCANSGFDFPSWRQGIAKALSCHVFTLAGNQEVNGINTIKLVRKPVEGTRETLWVDPTSYLPVRIMVTTARPHQRPAVQTDDFRWLSPTAGNLAGLHAAEQRGAIPSGFRSLPRTYVPLPGAVLPNPLG